MKKVLKILEFDKILERMQSYTESESVKKKIYKLEPYTTVEEAKAAQSSVEEDVAQMVRKEYGSAQKAFVKEESEKKKAPAALPKINLSLPKLNMPSIKIQSPFVIGKKGTSGVAGELPEGAKTDSNEE